MKEIIENCEALKAKFYQARLDIKGCAMAYMSLPPQNVLACRISEELSSLISSLKAEAARVRRMEDALILLYGDAVLSEGQVAAITGIDRITIRTRADELRGKSLRDIYKGKENDSKKT